MKLFARTYRQEIENAEQVQKQVLNMNDLLQIKGGDEGGIILGKS